MNDICLNRVPISPTQTCPPEIQILLDNAYVPFVLEFSMYWVPKLNSIDQDHSCDGADGGAETCMNKSADGELVLGFLEYDNFHCTPVAAAPQLNCTARMISIALTNDPNDPIFTKILWSSPIWKSPRSYKKFLNTLREENTLYNYSQMIRHLTFAPYRNRPQPSFSLPDIHLLSQKCFNITNLTFGHREDLDTTSTFISTFVTTQSKLKKLELFKCSNLFDSDLNLLSEFCNQLESINLSFCNNLSDVSISSLTQKNRQLKKIHLTNIPKLTNKGILSLVNNCPNLISFIFNIYYESDNNGGMIGGGGGGGNGGDVGDVANRRRSFIQNQITSMAFIHLLQNCKKLMEFSGHFSDNTASKILFELSKKRLYGRGSYYKNLEILKILPNGRACLFKTQLELKPEQNSESELLGNLAENCKNLRILVLKCNFSKLNRNSILKFKNLEELSVKLKSNQSLSDSHLKRLLSHPKLRECELGDSLTKDAKLFIKNYNNNSRAIILLDDRHLALFDAQ
ncbi:22051_t:CDS:2 [Rhizophagus irregularis]|nr:22051_t:CDS:2 [Rhizophagus irregularis]